MKNLIDIFKSKKENGLTIKVRPKVVADKETPVKPNIEKIHVTSNWKWYTCARCHGLICAVESKDFEVIYQGTKYCKRCGQAIDWEN